MADFQLPTPPLTPGDLYTSGEYTWVWVERDSTGYWQKQNQPVRSTGVADHQVLYSDGGIMNGSAEFLYDDDLNTVEINSSALSAGGYLLKIADVNGNLYNSISDAGLFGDKDLAGAREAVDGNFYARKDGKWQLLNTTGAIVTQSTAEPSSPTPTDGDIWFETDFNRNAADKRQIHVFDGSVFQKFFRSHVDDTQTTLYADGTLAAGYQPGDLVFLTYTNLGGTINRRELYMVLPEEGTGPTQNHFFKVGGTGTALEDIRRRPTSDAESLIHPLQTGSVTRVLGLKQEETTDHFLEMVRYNGGSDLIGWRFGMDAFTGYDQDGNPDIVIQRNVAEATETEGVINISMASDGTTTIDNEVSAIKVTVDDTLISGQQKALFAHYPSVPSGTDSGTDSEVIRIETTGSPGVLDENEPTYQVFRDGQTRVNHYRRYGPTGTAHRALRYRADGINSAGDYQCWASDNWDVISLELPPGIADVGGTAHGNYETDGTDRFIKCRITGATEPIKFSVDVHGNVMCNTLTEFSDASLKSGITYQNTVAKTAGDASTEYYGMDKLKLTKTANFTFTSVNDGPTELGVIADEIYKIMPDIISSTETGTKGVKIMGLVSVLVNAVKELDARVTALGG